MNWSMFLAANCVQYHPPHLQIAPARGGKAPSASSQGWDVECVMASQCLEKGVLSQIQGSAKQTHVGVRFTRLSVNPGLFIRSSHRVSALSL
jgi:hypothetical protein